MLHPDLAKLQEQYNAVLDEYEAGHLSYEQALTAVQAMSAIDGAGYLWMIDTASGAFLRATPGEAPVEADAAEFVPAQIPARGSAPWASQQDLLRPPSRPATSWSGGASPAGYGDDYDDQDAGYEEEPRPRRARSGDVQHAPRSRPKMPQLRFNLPPVIAANKRLIAVAAFAGVFLVLVLLRNGDDTPAVTENLPVATTAPSGSTAPPSTLPDTTVPPSTVAPDPSAPVPTEPEMNEVFRRLATGNQAELLALVAAESSPEASYPRRIIATARYAGYDKVGLGMRATSATTTEDGRVVSEVSLVDLAYGEVVGTGSAEWVRAEDGSWRLAQHVEFTPSS